MTKITFSKTPLSVTACGHAGSNQILCTAISTLMYTIPAAMYRMKIPCRYTESDGYFRTEVSPVDTNRNSALTVLNAVRSMLEVLSREYPDSILLTRDAEPSITSAATGTAPNSATTPNSTGTNSGIAPNSATTPNSTGTNSGTASTPAASASRLKCGSVPTGGNPHD